MHDVTLGTFEPFHNLTRLPNLQEKLEKLQSQTTEMATFHHAIRETQSRMSLEIQKTLSVLLNGERSLSEVEKHVEFLSALFEAIKLVNDALRM